MNVFVLLRSIWTADNRRVMYRALTVFIFLATGSMLYYCTSMYTRSLSLLAETKKIIFACALILQVYNIQRQDSNVDSLLVKH